MFGPSALVGQRQTENEGYMQKILQNRAKAQSSQQKLLERELETFLTSSSSNDTVNKLQGSEKNWELSINNRLQELKSAPKTAFIKNLKSQPNNSLTCQITDSLAKALTNSSMIQETYTPRRVRF